MRDKIKISLAIETANRKILHTVLCVKHTLIPMENSTIKIRSDLRIISQTQLIPTTHMENSEGLFTQGYTDRKASIK